MINVCFEKNSSHFVGRTAITINSEHLTPVFNPYHFFISYYRINWIRVKHLCHTDFLLHLYGYAWLKTTCTPLACDYIRLPDCMHGAHYDDDSDYDIIMISRWRRWPQERPSAPPVGGEVHLTPILDKYCKEVIKKWGMNEIDTYINLGNMRNSFNKTERFPGLCPGSRTPVILILPCHNLGTRKKIPLWEFPMHAALWVIEI